MSVMDSPFQNLISHGDQHLGAPIAQCVRDEAKIPVTSTWAFGAPKLADQALRNEQLDLVVIGRARMENPHWGHIKQKIN